MPCTAAGSRRSFRTACAQFFLAWNLTMCFVRCFCAVSGLQFCGPPMSGHPSALHSAVDCAAAMQHVRMRCKEVQKYPNGSQARTHARAVVTAKAEGCVLPLLPPCRCSGAVWPLPATALCRGRRRSRRKAVEHRAW